MYAYLSDLEYFNNDEKDNEIENEKEQFQINLNNLQEEIQFLKKKIEQITNKMNNTEHYYDKIKENFIIKTCDDPKNLLILVLIIIIIIKM